MLKNHLKVVLRNLSRHKGYTFMNVTGLALGMACCLFILFYVVDELSYDRHHEQADAIYRVAMEQRFPDREAVSATTPRSVVQALVSDVPDVVQATRFSRERSDRVMVTHRDRTFYEETVAFADPNVFEVFTIPMTRGNPATALQEPWTIVVTESVAQKYFGPEDPIGKTLGLRLRGDGDIFEYRITGVVEDMPDQSHFHFDFLATYQLHPFATNRGDGLERASWGGTDVYTYVELSADPDRTLIESKISDAVNTYLAPAVEANLGMPFDEFLAAGNGLRFFLQPLTGIHLHSGLENEIEANSDIAYIYFFSAIALFILVLACINFVNLSTARATRRAKEVGVRKVLGSDRRQLIGHYLSESMLLSFLALAVAAGLVAGLLPTFNGLTGKGMEVSWWIGGLVLPGLIAFTALVGVAAGAYPAFVLSAFEPARVLKGRGAVGTSRWSPVRSGLVVFQFAVTMALMVSTVVMYSQMDYMRSKKLGFDQERVVVIEGTEVLRNRTEAFREDVRALPGVIKVAHSETVPGRPAGGSWSMKLDGAPPEDEVVMSWLYAGFDFAETLELELVDGRYLSRSFAGDSTAALLNESAVRALGIDDPIGRRIARRDNFLGYTIVGVVKDFHFESPRQEIPPMAIFGPDPFFTNRPRELFVARLRPESLTETIAAIGASWDGLVPEQPFQYAFLDQDFNALFRAEDRTGRLFSIFTTLSILIACLGLFGLATFTGEQRIKEIGVRKTLGATVSNIVWLLSRDFAKPVLLAFILAAPIGYLLMWQWLQGFAYRIDLSWTVFVAVGTSSLAIALLTISYQAVRAAVADPVKSLRYE